ncbi:MAG: sn-glycerol-1-phosphate dehydrogenase [Ruminococcaceae bacterium]|nr:sn-glycerol-1-phosphate dehydrogenase [Oscillospiraceae bacterium]
MNIKSVLGGKNDCSCGKLHPCDIQYVEIGDGVLERLSEICAPFSHIHLVADANTYPLCGDRIKAILGEKITSEMIFGSEIVVPNEDAIAAIESKMANGTDLLLGIGSGVINDLCKQVSFANGMRYVIVATAPSMDGYASVGAALILEEMKVTLNARVPYAIIAENEVISTAPVDMLRSGYGDIIGKYSCLNDWKLAHLLRGEYFCQYVYDMVMETVKKTEGTAAAVLARDKAAIGNLMEGLVMVGIMMSYVGNSRPASGSEHHLSHFFEITGLLNNTPYYLHGIDVLYAAAATAQLREQLLALKPPFAAYRHDKTATDAEIRRVYTSAADGIIALQEKVGLYADINTAQFAEHWDAICEILREAPDYQTMLTYVNAIGLDINEFHRFYGDKTLGDAVLWAKDLKDRYTVLWLSYALGIQSLSL